MLVARETCLCISNSYTAHSQIVTFVCACVILKHTCISIYTYVCMYNHYIYNPTLCTYTYVCMCICTNIECVYVYADMYICSVYVTVLILIDH